MNGVNGTNSVDPRVMKELLQLQILSKLSLFSDDTSSSVTNDDSDFGALLQSLMGQGGDTDPTMAALGEVEDGTLPDPLSLLGRSYNPLAQQGLTSALPAASAASTTAFDGLIQSASRKYGVDASLVKALIQQESSFNHQAVSSAGAKGLMQLMDATGLGLGVTNPFDPTQNVEAGTRFLSGLLKKYNGNESVALAAYNAGPGRIDRLGIRTDQDLRDKLHLLPAETQAYVSKVLGYRQRYSS
ncbi:lytic transglycosylase domain-containing protein [Paenibacillus whitsoniae]|uniref:Lytic transglycosylase domain-containing protein n=1 Tax=Paenibacillus whitsoniae TaxID=2496558 RepID=A0A3S0C7G4_9BACL|nr:lytic transglycosylase domain-containing protein [Paenibacillus whitsoniae]RTE07712.1 lytic transglycosylase domain-containing protein [Paenibacillus whitsoniae]